MPANPQPRQTAPSLEDIETLAADAFESIPAVLARHLREVVIQIVDFPDPETEREMGLETPFDLLGLYRGVNLTEKSVGAIPDDLDMIFLYRRPLLDHWCETGEDLYTLVRHVLIHEIGHHFGFSDEDMAAIESTPANP